MRTINAITWYNYIAKRNGGYKCIVPYEVVGRSAEDVFETELIEIVKGKNVLDAGCGHGEFTLVMAEYAKNIVGFDFAEELIKIALKLKEASGVVNADFAVTKFNQHLPFKDEEFDVIYSRRGPISTFKQSRFLKKGGVILGIHNYPLPEKDVQTLLEEYRCYMDISVKTYQSAVTFFKNEEDFAEYLSSFHMNPDYTLEENKKEFKAILEKSYINGRIGIRESKQIWRAIKR